MQRMKTISEDWNSKVGFATDSYIYNIPMSEYFNMEEKIKAITIDEAERAIMAGEKMQKHEKPDKKKNATKNGALRRGLT